MTETTRLIGLVATPYVVFQFQINKILRVELSWDMVRSDDRHEKMLIGSDQRGCHLMWCQSTGASLASVGTMGHVVTLPAEDTGHHMWSQISERCLVSSQDQAIDIICICLDFSVNVVCLIWDIWDRFILIDVTLYLEHFLWIVPRPNKPTNKD